MAESDFIADYTISGPRLDVDLLLEKVVRRARCAVWRVGDVTEFGPEPTSGLRIPVYRGNFQIRLERAITGFVQRESALLRAARRLTGPIRGWDSQACLSTAVFVGPEAPCVNVSFAAPLLQVTARNGVTLEVWAEWRDAVQQADAADEARDRYGRRGPRS